MKKLLIVVEVITLVLWSRVTNTQADSLGNYIDQKVSVPTIVVLLGLGLLGMAGIAARKRKLEKNKY